jgi:CheY-like chemotaxis protein
MDRQKTVLLVEDSEFVQTVLIHMLSEAGHAVTAASTAAAAATTIDRFEVGIVDIHLPDGHGVAVAESLLRAGTVARVIFFTSETNAAVLERAARLGNVVPKDTFALLELLAS